MKRVFVFMMTLLLLSNCSSIMMSMMKNKMAKMSSEEKKEMMMQMMSSQGDDSSCSEMMEEEMDVVLNDSLSKAEKASVMLPICFKNILQTVDDDQKAQYLMDMVNKIIKKGYPCLPADDTIHFKHEIRNTIDDL